MNRLARLRGVALAITVLAVSFAGAGGPASADDPPEVGYRFVSMPDFLNADVGDVSGSPYYRDGLPNSTNPSYETAMATILDAVQAEGAAGLLSAGDLVEGHWGMDTAKTGVFGPVGTVTEKQAAVRRAALTYYPQAAARFAARGLTLYPALGDHEIGDNPWRIGKGGYEAFKYRNVGLFKRLFTNAFLRNPDGSFRFLDRPSGQAAGTAYTVRLTPEVQLITLDVFKRTSTDIVPELDALQFVWLQRVLDAAQADEVDWIIVQGHTPIAGPNRRAFSSAMTYRNGTASKLWKLLVDKGVDVYLSGEFHDITAHHVDGIAHVTHGGLIQQGATNYLVLDIGATTMTLTAKRFAGTADWVSPDRLWQTDMTKAKAAVLSYPAVPDTVGEMVIQSDHTVVSRSGALDVYTG